MFKQLLATIFIYGEKGMFALLEFFRYVFVVLLTHSTQVQNKLIHFVPRSPSLPPIRTTFISSPLFFIFFLVHVLVVYCYYGHCCYC